MEKVIQLDQERTDKKRNDQIEEAAFSNIHSETTNLCIENIKHQFDNILNAKAQLQLSVDTIYKQFKADDIPEVELDMQTHDINKTIHDLDTAEGNINKFLDYVRDTRSKI